MMLESINQMGRTEFVKAIQSVPADFFLTKLEKLRGKGRNDYPIRVLWDLTLSMIAQKLSSIAELQTQNSQIHPLPSLYSFSRFFALLLEHSADLNKMLLEMVQPETVIGVGRFAKERITYLWNVHTGIPFLWDKGTSSLENLLDQLPLERVRFLIGGSEYSSLCEMIWRRYRIRPIIPLVPDIPKSVEKVSYHNAQYDETAAVFCPGGAMVFGGFEEKRNTLKYLCAAKHYGYVCEQYETCPLKTNLRIPLETDPRIFTPLPRFSYRWQALWALYEKKGKVERILLDSIPKRGNRFLFLQLSSLLFASLLTRSANR